MLHHKVKSSCAAALAFASASFFVVPSLAQDAPAKIDKTEDVASVIV